MKFSFENFFNKYDQIRRKLDLASFTEVILKRKEDFIFCVMLDSSRAMWRSPRQLTIFHHTAQKMNFSIKGFFSKCDQIRSFLRIWSQLPKKSLKENFIFCAVSLSCMYMIYLLFSRGMYEVSKNLNNVSIW